MATASGGAAERRADQVAAALAARIGRGDLAAGARLPAERHLMAEFGVSRTAVREAIATLAARGLVATRLRHRPVVCAGLAGDRPLAALVGRLSQDLQGAAILFDARLFFECALVRWAALHARAGDLDALRTALAHNRAAVGDAERFDATDAAFHAQLYALPGNPLYPHLHRAYVDWLGGHWRAMARGPEIERMMVAGHDAVVNAIATRDPDRAEEAMRRHLTAAWEFVRSTFRS